MPRTGLTRASSLHGFATFSRIRLQSVRSLRTRTSTNLAGATLEPRRIVQIGDVGADPYLWFGGLVTLLRLHARHVVADVGKHLMQATVRLAEGVQLCLAEQRVAIAGRAQPNELRSARAAVMMIRSGARRSPISDPE